MGFSLPFLKPKKSQTLYFGLYITDSSLFGFLFDTKNQFPEIIAYTHGTLTAGFDKILEDTDSIISELELKSSEHIDKTIFFLHSWMIDDSTYEIKDPYKGIIKKFSKDLELDPMGYIDVQEALHEYLQKSSILNTVAIETNKTKFGISIYKGGKKVFSQYTARTDSVGEDLQSVLQSIPGSIVVPTKILVFGDIDCAEVASELATYEWDLKTFTQHPSIEVLKQQDINDALATTFSEEVISQTKVPSPSETAPIVQDSEDLKEEPSEGFGFVMGADVAQNPPPEVVVAVPVVTDEVLDTETNQVIPPRRKNLFAFFKFPKFNWKGNPKPAIFGVIAGIVLFLLLFIYEYFFHSINITVYLNSQEISDEFDITVPITESQTTELAVIKRTTVQEFEDEKSTTGTREDGEKATGDVVITNYTFESRTFPRGTELRKGDLIFTTDAEVKIASASGGTVDSRPIVPKEATVKATASEIGAEYNISKGSQLSVASLSDSSFKAFAETAFTGGSKKEVKTVSKADRDALAKSVTTKADESSSDVLGAAVTADDVFLQDMTEIRLAETEFSGEVGEEASRLSVKAQSEIEFYTVQKKALHAKVAELFADSLAEGSRVDLASLNVEIEDVDASVDEVDISVSAEGKSLKEVDSEAVLGASSFKGKGMLAENLKSQFEIRDVQIESSFSLSPWTPLFRKNITVTTVSQ